MVRTAIWQGDRLAVVEDIPAQICGACMDQFYDEDASDALRRLAENGFPPGEAAREIVVPVFTLNGRIAARVALAEDTIVD
jgi:YgiT-type zinc finger domain-containing protein